MRHHISNNVPQSMKLSVLEVVEEEEVLIVVEEAVVDLALMEEEVVED